MNTTSELPIAHRFGVSTDEDKYSYRSRSNKSSKLDDIFMEGSSISSRLDDICIHEGSSLQFVTNDMKPETTRVRKPKDIVIGSDSKHKKKAKKKDRSGHSDRSRSSSRKKTKPLSQENDKSSERQRQRQRQLPTTGTPSASEIPIHHHNRKERSHRKSDAKAGKRRTNVLFVPSGVSKSPRGKVMDGDQSTATASTAPSTPGVMRSTFDLNRRLRAIDHATSTHSQSVSTREASKKLKDRKKSKKSSKKNKKHNEKRKTAKKKMILSKTSIYGSGRSLGSFGSQRSLGSFGSQRSLGSFVSERGSIGHSVSERSLGSFGSLHNDDAASVSKKKHAIPKRVMAKGSRKVPLVSMPENSAAPHRGRKMFNDNVFRENSERKRSLSGGSHGRRLQKAIQQQQPLTPSTVPESPSSKPASEFMTHNSTSKFQMVPKASSFSEPAAPPFLFESKKTFSSDPGPSNSFFAESKKIFSSDPGLNNSFFAEPIDATFPGPFAEPTKRRKDTATFKIKKDIPKTMFCSAPMATHPNAAVSSAWASPFEDVAYAEPFPEPTPKKPVVAKSPVKPALTEYLEDDDIDDLWESYAPSALVQNRRKSLNSYINDDDQTAISALTVSTRTESIVSTMRPAMSAPTLPVRKVSRHVRPTSTSSPKVGASGGEGIWHNEDSVRTREGSVCLNDLSVRTREGSVCLNDSSIMRDSPPVPKEKSVFPFSYRQRKAPTVPRYHTPPRIRFGEGQLDPASPRAWDKSPTQPQRKPDSPSSNSSDSASDLDNLFGIPVVPDLFQSKSSISDDTPVSRSQDEISKSKTNNDTSNRALENQERNTKKDKNKKKTSHGICDAASGNTCQQRPDHVPPTPTHTELKTKKLSPESIPDKKDFQNNGRVGALIQSFECMDGNTKRAPSPGARMRRPKNLQQRLGETTKGCCGRRRGSTGSTIKTPNGRTRMAVKTVKPSPASVTKETIRGSSSDWAGSPNKVIRDISYHDKTSHASKETTREKSAETGLPATTKSRRRLSKTPTKAPTKKFIGDDAKTSEATAGRSPMRRKRPAGKKHGTKKTVLGEGDEMSILSMEAESRGTTVTKSPRRRRSKTPEKRFPASPRRRSTSGRGGTGDEKSFPRRSSRASNAPSEASPTTPMQRVKKFGKGIVHSLTPRNRGHHGGDQVDGVDVCPSLPDFHVRDSPSRCSRSSSAQTLPVPPKNSRFKVTRVKNRVVLQGNNRGQSGFEKANVQRRREKEHRKNAKEKADEVGVDGFQAIYSSSWIDGMKLKQAV